MKNKYLKLKTIATIISPLVTKPFAPGFIDLPKDESGRNSGYNFERTKKLKNTTTIIRTKK